MMEPPPKYKPGLGERLTITVVKGVIGHTIGAALESWGPMDLDMAIRVDANLLDAAMGFAPEGMDWGKKMAGIFPLKIDEDFLGNVMFEFTRKNYPNLFSWNGLPLLDGPEGKAWFLRNVKRFREYFWGG